MLRNKCAACATLLSQDTTSCVRPGCRTRYCNSDCLLAHWRDGHEQDCEAIARSGGAEQYYADQKYAKAAVEAIKRCAADTKGQTCYICMDGAEGSGEGLVRGCACRGAAGFVHLSCLVKDAQLQVEQGLEDEREHERPMLVPRIMRYLRCRLCDTDHDGESASSYDGSSDESNDKDEDGSGDDDAGDVASALGWACWKSYVGRPEGDHLRNIALQILADALKSGGRYAEALHVLEVNLARISEAREDADNTFTFVRNQIADCLEELERYDDCLDLRRKNYEACPPGFTKFHLNLAINYCGSLKRHDNAAAKEFMRDEDLVARIKSEFGDDHPTTHGCLQIYAFTLIGEPWQRSPDDDMAEAAAIITDIARRWQRRLGAKHPQAKLMQAASKKMQVQINKEAVAVAVEKCADDTKGQTCYICTEALHWKTNEGLVRMCSCRGTAGFAHVSCLAEQAKILVKESLETNLSHEAKNERWTRWHTCSLCEQLHHGVVGHALGWACWKTYVGRPETDLARRTAMQNLASGLGVEDKVRILEAQIATETRLGAPELNILIAKNNIANCYDRLGRREDVLQLRREVYARSVAIGSPDALSFSYALSLSMALVEANYSAEAKHFLCEQLPKARRALGAEDQAFIKLRRTYARCLCDADGATRDDVVEATTILEELSRMTRRLFGPSHSFTEDNDNYLRTAQGSSSGSTSPSSKK